jgi:uncharacterized repeat protein (TIGR03803 family)
LTNLRLRIFVCVVGSICFGNAVALSAQTFETLARFNGTNGGNPGASLIQGTDGALYGTTVNAGTLGGGTVFKITPTGRLITLYNFCSLTSCSDATGKFPAAPLLQTVNGNLYGTTLNGGTYNSGTVFEITPAGKLTTLYSFCSTTNCSDGIDPNGLVQGPNGNFYGTAFYGGTYNNGTVFEITPAGKLTTLYSFCPGGYPCVDGYGPDSALVLANDGNFYGTTVFGGSQFSGVVFKITPAGKLTTLHSFCTTVTCSDGALPYAGLVQAGNGNLYGTTYNGGANCSAGLVCGTIYEITRSGTLTVLYSFCPQGICSDGRGPLAGLVQATDGNFYGTTDIGSECTGVCSSIFKITPSGTLTTIHAFCEQQGCPNGTDPEATLLQATNGDLYGSTFSGGDSNVLCAPGGCGALFGLSVGLGSFIKATPGFGKAGQVVDILGNDLLGTTNVAFNGTAATFKVVSNAYIEARIPSGATTGDIEVSTPTGTLYSNVAFYVEP